MQIDSQEMEQEKIFEGRRRKEKEAEAGDSQESREETKNHADALHEPQEKRRRHQGKEAGQLRIRRQENQNDPEFDK